MAAGRLLIPSWMPALDSDGAPIPNARVYFFTDDTTTLAAVFADEALTTPLTNPVDASSSGRFPAIWASDTNVYTWSVDAPYGPAGIPFTGTGLQVSQDSAILVLAGTEAAADEALISSALAVDAYNDILALAAAAPDTDPIVIAGKANVTGSNILGANQAAFRTAIGADQAVNILTTAPGGVSRNQLAKNRDIVNLADYGGVGDGVTDNYAAWNSALAAIMAAGGGEIHVNAGEYYFATTPCLRSTGSYYAMNPVVSVIGKGVSTIFTRNLTSAGDAPDINNETQCFQRAGLAVFGSNLSVDGILFQDCGVGLLVGQDPLSVPLIECSFNRFGKLWFRDCGVAHLTFAPTNAYYSQYGDWHITQCQYGIIQDWHSGSPYDGVEANVNRNTFVKVRISRCWVGLWSKAGGTNNYLSLDFEGNQNPPTNNRYPQPTGWPGYVLNKGIAIISDTKSGNNSYYGTCEANDLDIYNRGIREEYAGNYAPSKCTFVTSPSSFAIHESAMVANVGASVVADLVASPMANGATFGDVVVPARTQYVKAANGQMIVATPGTSGAETVVQNLRGEDGQWRRKMVDCGAFTVGQTKTIPIQIDAVSDYMTNAAGLVVIRAVGYASPTIQAHWGQTTVIYGRNGSRTPTRYWQDTSYSAGGWASGSGSGANSTTGAGIGEAIGLALNVSGADLRIDVTANSRAQPRIILFIEEMMTLNIDL